MTEEKIKHLLFILEKSAGLIRDKYKKGAAEHREILWKKPDLLDEAINESVDLLIYLLTLRHKDDWRTAKSQTRRR